jgi:hypothetical protein
VIRFVLLAWAVLQQRRACVRGARHLRLAYFYRAKAARLAARVAELSGD